MHDQRHFMKVDGGVEVMAVQMTSAKRIPISSYQRSFAIINPSYKHLHHLRHLSSLLFLDLPSVITRTASAASYFRLDVKMATFEGTQQAMVAWFDERPIDGQIPDSSRRLLETYSGIAPDAIEEHVIEVRNEAWKVHPYPCIGQVCLHVV